MGSAGLEWDATDQPEKNRLNQKTTFVGTGAQISALTAFPGQLAYCTVTGSGFTIDNVYVRESTNTSWVVGSFTAIQGTSEANSTPITDNADFTAIAGTRYYAFITLPTTEKIYSITGIEWKNGASVAGNILCGIDIINADPPTIDSTPLASLGLEIAQSGTSVVQRNSNVMNILFPSGTLLGVWISCSSGSATLREQTGLSSQNQSKAGAFTSTPATSNTVTFTATTARKYIKIYYKGFL